jgi:23S rRNA (guanosine2251-2'-O)-methyltransferase
MVKIFRRDKRISPEDFLQKERNPIFVVLDNLRSAYNVGAIFRTCDAFMVEKLFLCGITSHPPNAKLKKTAMASEMYVPWKYEREAVETIRRLQHEGVKVYGCERTERSLSLHGLDSPLPCGFVFGNEAEGVSPEALEACDEIIEIPMMGFKNSLNVATTVGIVLYEIAKNLCRHSR